MSRAARNFSRPRRDVGLAKTLAFCGAAACFVHPRWAEALVTSSNWSGYDAVAPSGEAFTDVSASWVVPTPIASPGGTTYSSFWVGFDGVSDTTVEQCGISEQISSSGSASYSAWYEFAPAAETLVGFSFRPGDTIDGEVTYESSNEYQFILKDVTTGATYDMTKTTSRTDARSSAEWIAEAPSLGSSITNLADFGNVSFSNAVAALNGGSDVSIGSLQTQENEMVQTNVVALPTSIDSADTAFNVTYEPAALVWNNTGAFGPADGATWDFAGNNNWNTGSANAAYTDGDAVTFNDNNNGNYNVSINSYFMHPASVTVNSSGNYSFSGTGHISGTTALTKSGTGTLSLATSNSYTGGTFVTGGRLIIEPTGSGSTALGEGPVSITGGVLQLAPNVTLGSQSSPPASNVVITSLAISGSGQFDIGNNHIILDYASESDPVASIAALLAAGFNTGSWNGPGGIISTAAQANPGYGVGYADAADPGNPAGLSAGTLEIAYTLLGDANLDGIVNGIDFGILAANFNKGVTGWDEGDFNYDHVVNGTDFAELAANFNLGASGAAVGSPAYDDPSLLAFAAANGLLADVPEPGSALLAITGLTATLAHRRRSRPQSTL
jgi:autotransporter-associated beta strand protein